MVTSGTMNISKNISKEKEEKDSTEQTAKEEIPMVRAVKGRKEDKTLEKWIAKDSKTIKLIDYIEKYGGSLLKNTSDYNEELVEYIKAELEKTRRLLAREDKNTNTEIYEWIKERTEEMARRNREGLLKEVIAKGVFGSKDGLNIHAYKGLRGAMFDLHGEPNKTLTEVEKLLNRMDSLTRGIGSKFIPVSWIDGIRYVATEQRVIDRLEWLREDIEAKPTLLRNWAANSIYEEEMLRITKHTKDLLNAGERSAVTRYLEGAADAFAKSCNVDTTPKVEVEDVLKRQTEQLRDYVSKNYWAKKSLSKEQLIELSGTKLDAESAVSIWKTLTVAWYGVTKVDKSNLPPLGAIINVNSVQDMVTMGHVLSYAHLTNMKEVREAVQLSDDGQRLIHEISVQAPYIADIMESSIMKKYFENQLELWEQIRAKTDSYYLSRYKSKSKVENGEVQPPSFIYQMY